MGESAKIRATSIALALIGCSVPDASPGTAPACELPNAATTATTDEGCVVITCDEGYDDCDRLDLNGCEVHTAVETDNCGGCGVVCSFTQAEAECVEGVCSMAGCVSGFEDCDNDETNGCEAQVASSTEHCGACGKSCTFANAAALCSNGQCQMGSCETGWADCDASEANGCELQVAISAQNCGTCGKTCTFANAAAFCSNGQCQMGSCELGWADCDGDEANGCEEHVATSTQNCGTCGNSCAFTHASAVCSNGQCQLGACESGQADCDANEGTGCEVQLNSSPTNCGACGHDCFGGDCVTSACTPVVLASGQGEPWSIAVNGTDVYWTVHTNPGPIRRVPRDGGLVQTLATSEALPDGIALTADRAVWANTLGDSIRAVPLGGGSVETLTTTATGAKPSGVAVSDTHVFWTNWTAGSVQRVALAGGSPEDLSTANNLPHRIVTDGSYVWWTNIGGNSVRRVDAAGGGVTTIADGQAGALGVAIDATHVFWSNQGDLAISRASIANGAINVLASAPAVPAGIAVDDMHVYFTDGHPTGSVRRVLKTGGAVETLASDQSSPLYIAVDADSVYWTNRVGGTIMRLAK